jgi:hypothetical protein
MQTSKNFIATKLHATLAALGAFVLIGMVQGEAWAAPVGTVTDVSGPLLARKADGVVKILSAQSTVDQGDTLVSEKGTYARIKFIDNSEITLRPNTQFKIENFSYEDTKPEEDHAIFSLIKGGLRSITGLLGKRNKERFGLNTPTATIGIRGTNFIAEYVPPSKAEVAAYQAAALASAQIDNGMNATRTDAPSNFLPKGVLAIPDRLNNMQLAQNTVPTGTDGRNPGLYVQVLDGTIHVTNQGGTQNFTAGQFGFTPGFQQPPVILPANPGMQFTPPPSFSSTTTSQGGSGGAKPGDVDCQVR